MFYHRVVRGLMSMFLLGALTVGNAAADDKSDLRSADPHQILGQLAQQSRESLSGIDATALNGHLLRMPGSPHIFLVLDGVIRRIAGPDILANLFRTTCTVYENPFTALLTEGMPITEAYLLNGISSKSLSLFIDGKTRYLGSMAVVNKYCFDTDQALNLPDSILVHVPKGPAVP